MDKNEKIEYTHFKKKEKKKCFICRENAAGSLILFFLLLACAFIAYKYIYKVSIYKENGVEYTLTKYFFTKNNTFEFKIKNTSKENKIIKYDDLIFEILNRKQVIVFFKSISIDNKELIPNSEYKEIIEVSEDLKYGKHIAVVFLDTNDMKKRVDINFNVGNKK
jgi:hypothetical protein